MADDYDDAGDTFTWTLDLVLTKTTWKSPYQQYRRVPKGN